MKQGRLGHYIIPLLVIGMFLTVVGQAAAQHQGGLGIKKVPLNIATVKQLLKIDGMTEDLAKAIVSYREKSGFFKKPEDLLKVPGMTKVIYEKLGPKVGVEGDIYCVPKEGAEDEDEEPLLAPSKC